jgi:hypothetical protein
MANGSDRRNRGSGRVHGYPAAAQQIITCRKYGMGVIWYRKAADYSYHEREGGKPGKNQPIDAA